MTSGPFDIRAARRLVGICGLCGWIGLVVLSAPAVAQPRTVDRLEQLTQQHRERQQQFAADLKSLADTCEEAGFLTDALRIRAAAEPIDLQALDIDQLPTEVQAPLPAGLSVTERQWRARYKSLRDDYAQELFLLSQRALRERQPGFAYDLIREVVIYNPDHLRARELLGFVRRGDNWTTPFLAQMATEGYEWHDRFGWLPRTFISRYEAGERRLNDGRWVSAERERAVRADFRNAWIVPTEHFRIHTNVSLERGVELAAAIEEFHRFFKRTYAAIFNTPQQMQALLGGNGSGRPQPPLQHDIYYFRSKEEYVAQLQHKQPGVEISNGLYFPPDRAVYFFYDAANPGANLETLYHEVTHQLLAESGRIVIPAGEEANYWVIEGFACYLESFRVQDGKFEVGNPDHPRLFWARRRVVEDGFYVPLASYTPLGRDAFRNVGAVGELQKYYSQATGLCHFFLNYDNGCYREAFLQHLGQIYSADARVRTRAQPLDQLTGVAWQVLDNQYLEYIRALPVDERLVPAG